MAVSRRSLSRLSPGASLNGKLVRGLPDDNTYNNAMH